MLGGGRWTEVRAEEGKDMREQVYDRQMDSRGSADPARGPRTLINSHFTKGPGSPHPRTIWLRPQAQR